MLRGKLSTSSRRCGRTMYRPDDTWPKISCRNMYARSGEREAIGGSDVVDGNLPVWTGQSLFTKRVTHTRSEPEKNLSLNGKQDLVARSEEEVKNLNVSESKWVASVLELFPAAWYFSARRSFPSQMCTSTILTIRERLCANSTDYADTIFHFLNEGGQWKHYALPRSRHKQYQTSLLRAFNSRPVQALPPRLLPFGR